MNYDAVYGHSESFEKHCDYCGAEFRVHVPRQAGHEESEEYFCPECKKMYKTRASNSPSTTIINKRTDGKTDRYVNEI